MALSFVLGDMDHSMAMVAQWTFFSSCIVHLHFSRHCRTTTPWFVARSSSQSVTASRMHAAASPLAKLGRTGATTRSRGRAGKTARADEP